MQQRASTVDISSEQSQQMRIFYRCLGFALLGHEFNWISMNVTAIRRSIFSYIDSYSDLVPVLHLGTWPTGIGHLFFFVAAAVLIFSGRQSVQRAAALLCVPFLLLAFFVQGYKPANHYFLLMMIVLIHAAYVLLSRRSATASVPAVNAADEATEFLRRTLLYVVFLTYLLAGISKLNTDFMIPESTISALFVWKPVSPFNRLAKFVFGEGASDILCMPAV